MPLKRLGRVPKRTPRAKPARQPRRAPAPPPLQKSDLPAVEHAVGNSPRPDEQFLHASEILESITDAFYTIDADWRLTYVNHRTEEWWHLPRQELIGKRLGDLVPYPLEIPGYAEYQRAMRERVPVHFETRGPDSETWVEVHAYPASDGGLATYVRDITERKRIAEELAKSEQKANDLIRYAPAAIYEIDSRTARFTTVNDAMCAMTGYTRQELLAMNAFDLLDAESQDRFRERLVKTLKGQPIDESVEYRVIVQGGREVYIVLKTTILYQDGKPVGAFVIGHDVTERRKIEQSLREALRRVDALNRDLEQRAAELESTNKDLDAFTYSVSHDLRAPLAAIENFAAVVLQDHPADLPPDARMLVDLIGEHARHMQALVQALLGLSRSVRQPLNRQLTQPGVVVQAVLQDLDREGGDYEIIAGELPPCEADTVLLKQVYTNLLSNAIKYTRAAEHPRIEIGCTRGANGEITYYVKDNGIGFDMAQAGKLFGVFQRLHAEEEYEGTGLGLAIVQRIIRRHGGLVWAEAQPGQGATFYFTLPTSA